MLPQKFMRCNPEDYGYRKVMKWIPRRLRGFEADAVKFFGYHYPEFYEDPSTDDLHVKPNRFALRR